MSQNHCNTRSSDHRVNAIHTVQITESRSSALSIGIAPFREACENKVRLAVAHENLFSNSHFFNRNKSHLLQGHFLHGYKIALWKPTFCTFAKLHLCMVTSGTDTKHLSQTHLLYSHKTHFLHGQCWHRHKSDFENSPFAQSQTYCFAQSLLAQTQNTLCKPTFAHSQNLLIYVV